MSKKYISRMGERPAPTRRPMTASEIAERAPRLNDAIADADKLLAQPSAGQRRQHSEAMRAVSSAAHNAITALNYAISRGETPPSVDELVKDHAARLPAFARSEVQSFLDEAVPILSGGERGSVREGVRHLASDVADEMVDRGWTQPAPEPSETPDQLAAMIPRI